MKILENIKLAPYTTFKIGGKAKFFGIVKNIEDLKEGVSFSEKNSLPLLILGGGSNLLISDKGFNGLVLKIEIKDLEARLPSGNEVEIVAGAGIILDELIEETTQKNLWGMENLSWIPGTVGASVVQNCGAFRVEAKDLISWLEILNIETGEILKLNNKECQFSYRNSIFKQKPNWIVTRVCFILRILDNETLDRFANAREPACRQAGTTKQSFSLTDFASQNPSRSVDNQSNEDGRGRASSVTIAPQSSLRGTKQSREKTTSQDARNEIIEKRKKNFPLNEGLGSAGCFFKNPIISKNEFEKLKEKFPEVPNFEEGENVKIPIAWFIDKFGWKGFCEGEVGVYDKHALMLVNKGQGTCEEIKNLAQKISNDVFKKTGLKLEEEVVIVN